MDLELRIVGHTLVKVCVWLMLLVFIQAIHSIYENYKKAFEKFTIGNNYVILVILLYFVHDR